MQQDKLSSLEKIKDFLDDLSKKKNKLKATTIRNYFYYLSGLWYPEMVYRDQGKISAVDLYSSYENMVHRLAEDKSINRKIGLLKNLHDFVAHLILVCPPKSQT